MEKLTCQLEDLLSEVCDEMCKHRDCCSGEDDVRCEECVLDKIRNLFEQLKRSDEGFRTGYLKLRSRVHYLAEDNEAMRKQQALYQARIRELELKVIDKIAAEEDIPGADAYLDHDFIEKRFTEVI